MALLAIRTDAHIDIGSGHLIRCLTLAAAAREADQVAHFFSYRMDDRCRKLIEQQSFPLTQLSSIEDTEALQEELKKSADAVLVVDHYQLGAPWERKLQPFCSRRLAIDDLGRDHDCEMIVDQNYYAEASSRYRQSPATKLCLGPSYALLRPEFAELRTCLRPKNFSRPHFLVFYGATDPSDESSKALEALGQLDPDRRGLIRVVIGKMHPKPDAVKFWAGKIPRVEVCEDFAAFPRLLADTDIALGAGGTTTWERACLGVPSLVTVIADNQVVLAREADRAGLIFRIGESTSLTPKLLLERLKEILSQSSALETLSKNCLDTVDGQGAARVVKMLESLGKA